VPSIATVGEFAAWLEVEPDTLDWMADAKGLLRNPGSSRLLHHRYRWLPKRHGGVRLLEAPKPRLRTLQRPILAGILNAIPPHGAAHGFRAGRSVLSFAAPYVGQPMVLRLDLEDFFSCIGSPRIRAVFRAAGYPDEVAHVLAALCTTRTPRQVLEGVPPGSLAFRTRRHFATPHLALPPPRRSRPVLAPAGREAGPVGRYADDLAFSGGDAFARGVHRFEALAGAIAL
jgi:RNA-directed DNA polymerase